jgi:hypothetical protein
VNPDRRRFILAIAAIIALPIIFAVAGGGRGVGVAIGVILVVVGIVSGVLGTRKS